MMLDVEYSGAFKREVRRAILQGRDILKMFMPVAVLLNGDQLAPQYCDHPMKGQWEGYRNFHVEPDWVVLYRLEGALVRFERTGTHSELFKK